MATNNSTLLDKIWLNSTNDYQQRIPNATQNGIAATVNAIFDPENLNWYNQFVDSLINRIGMTYVHQQSFTNPLSQFKKSRMLYGATEQEIAVKWIKAHTYVDDAEDVFKMYRPDASVWYHTQNREDMYPITVVREELYRAFIEDDGLARFVSAIMQVPINSDEYDEYRIMMQLIAFYENNFGFYKHSLSAAPLTEAAGKEFLTALRTYSKLLKFPSARYNSGLIPDVPVFVDPSELILLITPEYSASVDVNTLSSVFQLDKADIQYRTVDVDEFPIPNAVALLTTTDFFRCRDTLYQTASIYNPKTLGNNYFLHHWGIYSVSPFVPTILFTTDTGTGINVVTQSVTGIDLTPATQNVAAGDEVQLTVELTGSISPANDAVTVAPDSAIFSVGIVDGDGAAVKSPRTRVDKYGVLHVADTLTAGSIITVTAKASYINPSGTTTEYTDTATFTVQ